MYICLHNEVFCIPVAIRQFHTSDSRRSYQIVKFLVNLANKCPVAKDYLLQAATKWQWAVNWLKSKVSPSLRFRKSWRGPQFFFMTSVAYQAFP